MASNLYATDGKCHNANRGTYGHECGKPAVWLGRKSSGFTSGFCDHCKRHGDDAAGMVQWVAIATQDLEAIARATVTALKGN